MLDKKKDIQTLWNLGAKQKSIQKIFFNEGILLIIIGSILGIFLGLLLAYLQMKFIRNYLQFVRTLNISAL